MPELVPHLLPYVGCISHGVNVVGGEEQPRGPGLPFAFLPRGFFFFFLYCQKMCWGYSGCQAPALVARCGGRVLPSLQHRADSHRFVPARQYPSWILLLYI